MGMVLGAQGWVEGGRIALPALLLSWLCGPLVWGWFFFVCASSIFFSFLLTICFRSLFVAPPKYLTCPSYCVQVEAHGQRARQDGLGWGSQSFSSLNGSMIPAHFLSVMASLCAVFVLEEFSATPRSPSPTQSHSASRFGNNPQRPSRLHVGPPEIQTLCLRQRSSS